jgi:putative acetyltransferase
MRIRREHARDIAAVRQLNRQAFGSPEEAAIVDVVRAQAQPIISLVAEDADAVIGHILFSPVTLNLKSQPLLMGLAPMAVVPARQRTGVGSALVNAGLHECRLLGAVGIVVIGHPEYYPRFGFVAGSSFGLTCEFEVPDEVFMARELVENALRSSPGTIRYHPAFSGG